MLEDINNYTLDGDIPKELENLKNIRDTIFKDYNQIKMQIEDIKTYENELSLTRQILKLIQNTIMI